MRHVGSPVTHSTILRAVGSELPLATSLRWKRLEHFSLAGFLRVAKEPLESGAPLLMTCRIRHKWKRLTGIHCVVVVSADSDKIEMIDSLGRRNGKSPNASVRANRRYGYWPVDGAPILVSSARARVLVGLPAISQPS